MKKIILFLMIFGLSSFNIAWLKAQKKEISMAKTAIKKGTNLAQAQQSITSLLADSVHQQNETLEHSKRQTLFHCCITIIRKNVLKI